MVSSRYRLTNAKGQSYESAKPGRFGGHRRTKIYGQLDCRSALRWLAKGHYATHRVFFRDARSARSAGYRPCAICLPEQYAVWKRRADDK
ncbi:MAG: Ada metal-binding domain-containing protein [Alphaproteobacteria bacterium]